VALEDARQRELPKLVSHHVSEMYTGTCCLPLWDRDGQPDEIREIVERRDQVLIGRFSFVARATPTFFIRWWSTKGPFFTERPHDLALVSFFMPELDDMPRVRLFLRVL